MVPEPMVPGGTHTAFSTFALMRAKSASLSVIIICVTIAATGSRALSELLANPYAQLHANIELAHEYITLDNEIKHYLLLDLIPGHSYEARVSHPASVSHEYLILRAVVPM